MTLATFNRYVDHVTGVSKTAHSSELPGVLLVGDQVLYWAEDVKRKRRPKSQRGKHAAPKKGIVAFFRGSFPIPRKPLLFHKLVRLFGIR